jgi:DGQHR domain-containing protein
MKKREFIEVPAIAVLQCDKRELYAFAVDGKRLHEFAQVSRLGRQEHESIAGYQRPEVISHIAEIRNYLESEAPMLPNAIVVAFDTSVKFRPLAGNARGNGARHGHLIIPLPEKGGGEKPAWIVDGQQRAAAIRDARVEAFPVFVTGFITDSIAEQREQFILVNSTKPLPKGLIYELLPATDVHLSTQLERKRFPACLLERLNYDSRSPLHLAIQTPTNPFMDSGARSRRGFGAADERGRNGEGHGSAVMVEERGGRNSPRASGKIQGFIKDNSILRMLENSLHDGALYRCKLERDGEMDTERMLQLLFNFWHAVAVVFQNAWQLPPTRSRLTHGVGIISMGHVMDAIADRYRAKGIPSEEEFVADLRPLEPVCSWTAGYWNFGTDSRPKWDEIQNTSRHIQTVANFLLVQYKRLVWSK